MTVWMVGKSRLSTASTVRRPRPGRPKTLSVTTAPPIRMRDAEADHGQDRHGGVAQRMAHQHDPVGEALGAGGADVVLVQHLEHAGARDAGDQRDEADRQGERRQDHALEEAGQKSTPMRT